MRKFVHGVDAEGSGVGVDGATGAAGADEVAGACPDALDGGWVIVCGRTDGAAGADEAGAIGGSAGSVSAFGSAGTGGVTRCARKVVSEIGWKAKCSCRGGGDKVSGFGSAGATACCCGCSGCETDADADAGATAGAGADMDPGEKTAAARCGESADEIVARTASRTAPTARKRTSRFVG